MAERDGYRMPDVVTTAFLALRDRFFDATGASIPFALRDKRNTQDDPFDEYLASEVLAHLHGITCAKARGPLITPDMVLFRPTQCRDTDPTDLVDDLDAIVGIEVKKLERTAQGGVARASGLDYNTTPPCGKVRVYDAAGKPIDVRGFYLFVCLETAPGGDGDVVLTAMCLVDGAVLNDDFELYLSITGEREKLIGLGTYGDGADRARPMLIFSNPLGVRELDGVPTLVHPDSGLAKATADIKLVHHIRRSVADEPDREFHCYRCRSDVPAGWKVTELVDPFPTPERVARTRPRGRFKLPFRL